MGRLVLTRYQREEIVIGKAGDVLTGPITIGVGKLMPFKVQLTIDCQTDIAADRREIYEKKIREGLRPKKSKKTED